uniref:Uncharacterized protein n=1 Tax=Glossina austeni TaxID=7395 RepID=A0A1A9UTU0_GLOAU
MDEKEKLERIFRNALPDYMWDSRQRDFNSLEELLELADDLETVPATNSINSQRRTNIRRNGSCYHINDGQRGTAEEQNRNAQPENFYGTRLKREAVGPEYPTCRRNNYCSNQHRRHQFSFLSQQFSEPFNSPLEELPTEVEVTLANGTTVHVQTALQWQVQIVMPKASDDVVLGSTFLKAFKAVITVAGLSTTCETLDNPFEHWSVANHLTSQERISDQSDA